MSPTGFALSQLILFAYLIGSISSAPANRSIVVEPHVFVEDDTVNLITAAPDTTNKKMNTTTMTTTTTTTTTTTEAYFEPASYLNTSTFSCYGRELGYYADIKLDCKIYHFCSMMENFGEQAYQRVSYLCLEDTYFDQGDLNCVKQEYLTVPCEKAEEYYDSSNKQFDSKEESQPSISDNLAANIMLNPITRFITG